MDCSPPGSSVHETFRARVLPAGGASANRKGGRRGRHPQGCTSAVSQLRHSAVSDSATPGTAACQASLSITNSRSSPNSRPASQWCHPAMSSSVVLFSSHLQTFPAWESFQMSPFFASGGQSIGASASASASVLPKNIQDWFPLGWTGWLDLLAVQGTLKSLLQHHSSKASILWRSAFFIVQFSHPYMTTGKTIALTRQTFVSKVLSLLFNMVSRLVIAFLPRSKRLLISWLQSPSAVIWELISVVNQCKYVNISYLLYYTDFLSLLTEKSYKWRHL